MVFLFLTWVFVSWLTIVRSQDALREELKRTNGDVIAADLLKD